MKKIITVTAKDIAASNAWLKKFLCGRFKRCPIALAAQRAFKKPGMVGVNGTELYLMKNSFYSNTERIDKIILLPKAAQNFIKRFDKHLNPKPIRFTINV